MRSRVRSWALMVLGSLVSNCCRLEGGRGREPIRSGFNERERGYKVRVQGEPIRSWFNGKEGEPEVRVKV